MVLDFQGGFSKAVEGSPGVKVGYHKGLRTPAGVSHCSGKLSSVPGLLQ